MSALDMLGGMGGPQGGPPAGGDGGGDPQGDLEDIVKQALDLIRQAIPMEKDHEDAVQLEDISSRLQKYLATQQKMVDAAMGAGPGTKAVRKLQGGGGY